MPRSQPSTSKSKSRPNTSNSQPSTSKSRPNTSNSQSSDATPNKRKGPSDSQANSSQKLSAEDINELVKNTIVYVLSQDHNKMPIRRTEITRHAMKTPGKMYNTIMKEVQKQLEEIYGLQLVDLDNTSQRYAILNKFDSKYTSGLLTVPTRLHAKQALLMTVLALIFMSQNVVAEADMWNFLRRLRLLNHDSQIPHPLFGDVRKLVTHEFVRQLYVDYRRVAESNPPIMEFHWGQRALKEVSKREILNFVCKMYSDMNPTKWTTQWQEIKRDEENGTQDL